MKSARALQRPFFLTLFLFGLLTWVYVVAIQITHPNYLDEPLTHIRFFPLNLRVDLTGIMAFVVSAVGFFLWRATFTDKQ